MKRAKCLLLHWHRDRTYGRTSTCTCRTCGLVYP